MWGSLLAAAHRPHGSEVRTGSGRVHQVQAHPRTRNWTLGPVQPQCRILDWTWVWFTEGSGPDQSSEPNCGIPMRNDIIPFAFLSSPPLFLPYK